MVTILAGLEDGNRLPSVPKTQGAVSGTYVIPMDSEWESYIHGIVQYVGSRVTQFTDYEPGFGTINLYSFDPNNLGGPFTQDTVVFNPVLPSYTVANARVGFRNDRWDVAFYINNLTNEQALLALDNERGTRARCKARRVR